MKMNLEGRFSQRERILFLMEKFKGWRPEEIKLNFHKEPLREEAERILVIKPDPIGDVVSSTPALRGLRERFKDAFISFLGREDSVGVVEGSPILDEVMVFPEHLLAKRVEEKTDLGEIYLEIKERVNELKKRRFDLVINLTTTACFAVLAGLIEGKCTRGVVFDEFGKFLMKGNLWIVYLLYVRLNRVMRDLNLLGWEELCLRVSGVNPTSRNVEFSIDRRTRNRCKEVLGSLGVKERDLVIGVNPGAYLPVRRWPVEYFSTLIRRLVKDYKAKVILFGKEDDVVLAHRIESLSKVELINLAGKTQLKELGGFLSLCDYLITNDTGPMHIGGAVGAKVIVICGPTRVGPHGGGHLLIEGALPCINCGPTTTCKKGECMEAVFPEDVYEAFRFHRGESQKILSNPKINLYLAPKGEPTRLFRYYPLKRKDWKRGEVAKEILPFILLNLFIRENNKIESYEEEISSGEIEREALHLEGISKRNIIEGIDECLELLGEYEDLLKRVITQTNKAFGTFSSPLKLKRQLSHLFELYERGEEGVGRIFSFLEIIYPKEEGREIEWYLELSFMKLKALRSIQQFLYRWKIEEG
jgi:ADP-heptose:LPS heptosyltransferase